MASIKQVGLMLPNLNFRVQNWNLAGNNPSTLGVEAGGSKVLDHS